MKYDRMDAEIEHLIEARGDVQFDVKDVDADALRRGRKSGFFNFMKPGSGIDPEDWALVVIKAKRQRVMRGHETVRGKRRRKYFYLSSVGLWQRREALHVNQLLEVAKDYEALGQAIDAKRDGVYEMIDELRELAKKLNRSTEHFTVRDVEQEAG